MHPEPSPSIVVGVDGSDAAIGAAVWAVDEAVARELPLRLVHAVPVAANGLEMEYAETALRAADAAVAATGKAVKVETAVVAGHARAVLIDQSRFAAMACVGSVGIGRVARLLLGSTAAALANSAYCPVAVIRARPAAREPDNEWIAVTVDDAADNDGVVGRGFAEAQLRHAPLIAAGVCHWGRGEDPEGWLDRRLQPWIDRYPGVRVQSVIARHGFADFVTGSDEPIGLAVVGSADARRILRFVGPVGGTSIFDHAECSVLVVRS
jgi:nucleotide-binding universal stress UspA family protein